MITEKTLEKLPLYIGGEFVETGRTITVPLPYDGSPVAQVAEADEQMVDRAIAAAAAAFPAMRELSNAERSDLLFRLQAIVQRDLQEFSRLICLETGKPIREAMGEADRVVQTLIAAAIEARKLGGEYVPINSVPTAKDRMAIAVREPLGIVGCITPFNVPLNLAIHKVGPALAAGNSVVHKPATQTPLSALRLARAIDEAGFPKGAYNVVVGSGSVVGECLVRDPRIAMITFTGSVPVGLGIRERAGLKRVTLELGSNSALVVEPDADVPLAVNRSVFGAFAHSGQICISVQRLYVHESIADDFIERYKGAAEKLKIGHPLEPSTEHSSLISEQEAIRVENWIEEAKAAGARTITGGARRYATIPPTILEGVPSTAKVSCQEVFGPVVAIERYGKFEDAIAKVNDSRYGLQAGIFTSNINRAFQAAKHFHVGGVIINDVPTFRADPMPYGGVKESGAGREGPKYAIEEMTELKLICWKI